MPSSIRSSRPSRVLLAAALFGAASAPAGRADAQIDRPVYDDVFYHFMPIAWRDSNNDQFRYGDFGGMTASLDYLQGLGITAVWMNPIFTSPAYHGYHHRAPSANNVNPWFGTEAEFFAFVNAAHARGIKVFVDLVAYGVSRDDVYFQSASGNPSSPYDSWLAFTNSGNTQYSGSTYTTWTGSTVRFIDWDMRDSANGGAMRNQMIAWCRHWLDPNNDGNPADGIDGYRLDHVLVTNDHGPNGWGYNLADFWTPWHASLRTLNPRVFTFAEQADWGSTGAEFLPVFNAALAKPMLFAIRDGLNASNASGIRGAIQQAVSVLPADAEATNRTFMACVGDHDVDRFTSVIGNDLGRARAGAAILLTQPLTPMLYYGDEIGMLGVKGNFGSDANDIPMREPFKWKRVAGAPMSNYFAQNTPAYNARYSRDNDGRSVEEQEGVAGSLLETYRSLIAVRKGSVALKRGRYVPVTSPHAGVYACVRHADAAHGGPQGVLVVINLTGQNVSTSLDLSSMTVAGGSTTPVALFGPGLPTITSANRASYPVSLAPFQASITAVDLAPAPDVQAPADIDGRNIPADTGAMGPVGAGSATQTCATGFGDNLSELDRLFVKAGRAVRAGSLRVGITGNLEGNGNAIVVLIDTGPGGQNTLSLASIAAPPQGITELTGLGLDPGFAPDTMYYLNASGGGSMLYVDQVLLPAAGSGVPAKTFRGSVGRGTGRGALAGGVNPNSLFVAFDNSNVSGVTASSVVNAAGATTGLEMLIPYADLFVGAPACGILSVAAFVTSPSGYVSNQFLPGVPFGSSNLGPTPSLAAVAGIQFLTVPLVSPADLDDGTQTGTPDLAVDINDLLFFLGRFEDGSPAADHDDGTEEGRPDGGVDVNDLVFMLGRFEAGC